MVLILTNRHVNISGSTSDEKNLMDVNYFDETQMFRYYCEMTS